MNKMFILEKKKILSIIVLSFSLLLFFSSVRAEISFSNIEISNLKNGRANISWRTNEETKGDIYYGLDEENLDRYMGYSLFQKYHESVLTGLKKDKTYYYKIKAINQLGEEVETFIYNFSTKDMEDTVRPDFEESKILQVTHNAVAIRWITNEETKAKIYYSTDPDNLSKKATYGSYKKEHVKFIYKLKSDERYYLKIKAIDRDGNFRTKMLNFHTSSSGSSSLKISNMEPRSLNSDLITSRTTTIKWKTNLISKGVVYYGTKSGKLNKKIYVSPLRALEHEAKLKGLLPNTTYYYKIKAYKSLYNKSKSTREMSFKTRTLENQYTIGTLVKGLDPEVYVIKKNGKKAWIKNEDVFLGLGYKWRMIKQISDDALNEYKETDDISSTKKHSDGTLIKYADKPGVYLIENGKKRPFFTEKAFTRKGYDWDDVITISSKKKYKTGKNLY